MKKLLFLGLLVFIPYLGIALSAANKTVHTTTNKSVSGSLGSLVSDGQGPFMFTVTQNSPEGTALVSSNGEYNFSPNADFEGTTSFQYRVIDAKGDESAPATITVEVGK